MRKVDDSQRMIYTRGAQPFWAKGRGALFSVHSRAKTKL